MGYYIIKIKRVYARCTSHFLIQKGGPMIPMNNYNNLHATMIEAVNQQNWKANNLSFDGYSIFKKG